jgi:hypothetical protein
MTSPPQPIEHPGLETAAWVMSLGDDAMAETGEVRWEVEALDERRFGD